MNKKLIEGFSVEVIEYTCPRCSKRGVNEFCDDERLSRPIPSCCDMPQGSLRRSGKTWTMFYRACSDIFLGLKLIKQLPYKAKKRLVIFEILLETYYQDKFKPKQVAVGKMVRKALFFSDVEDFEKYGCKVRLHPRWKHIPIQQRVNCLVKLVDRELRRLSKKHCVEEIIAFHINGGRCRKDYKI